MVKFGNEKFVSAHIFANKFGKPVITHAVPTKKIFFNILEDNLIKIPSENKLNSPHQYLNNYFNIHNCVYFSAGWEYNATYHQWPFAFIFKPSILAKDDFETFKTFIISQAWMNVLRYWRDYDKDYLLKLSKQSKTANQQINLFLKRDACSFWLFEKNLEKFLKMYPDKKQILHNLDKFKDKNKLRNSYAQTYVNKHFFENDYSRRLEIVSHKSVSLNTDKLLGVYINKSVIDELLPKLTKYLDKNKIIFDGYKKNYLYNFKREL